MPLTQNIKHPYNLRVRPTQEAISKEPGNLKATQAATSNQKKRKAEESSLLTPAVFQIHEREWTIKQPLIGNPFILIPKPGSPFEIFTRIVSPSSSSSSSSTPNPKPE